MRVFEIVDRNGTRYSFNRDEGYWWAWRPKSGTADVDDPDFLDVFKHSDDDEDSCIFITFIKPALVGAPYKEEL